MSICSHKEGSWSVQKDSQGGREGLNRANVCQKQRDVYWLTWQAENRRDSWQVQEIWLESHPVWISAGRWFCSSPPGAASEMETSAHRFTVKCFWRGRRGRQSGVTSSKGGSRKPQTTPGSSEGGTTFQCWLRVGREDRAFMSPQG